MHKSLVNQVEIKNRFSTSKVLFDEPLKKYTYTKVGGRVDALFFPQSAEEIQRVLAYSHEKKLPWLVLGNASNLIIRDGGIRGIVLMLTEMKKVEVKGNHLIAQAGAELADVADIACQASLSGLAFSCGIPGSIGGAAFMNAGAYDGEIKDCLKECVVLKETGEVVTLASEAMNFSYRHSVLQEMKAIVLSATFFLKTGDKDEIQKEMDRLNHLRQSKQPLEYPSCGSVFKRPEGYFTGKLIQEAGLQGFTLGGVQVSEKHAGFIVNKNNGCAKDYEELIAHIIRVVEEKFAVQLQTEVRIIGEE